MLVKGLGNVERPGSQPSQIGSRSFVHEGVRDSLIETGDVFLLEILFYNALYLGVAAGCECLACAAYPGRPGAEKSDSLSGI